MRANIIKKIDCNLLDIAIEEFECTHYLDKNGNYLIMSEKTLKELSSTFEGFLLYPASDCLIEYHGNRIAIDNSLPYGEVEIR